MTLSGKKELRCRVVMEKPGALQVELESGVVVDLPKRRIAKVERNVASK